LHTTPAGLAALALGAGNASAVTETMEPLIRDGHFLQVGLRTMLPGLFMISGQDLSGALPLGWYAMSDSAENWDIALASRGAHAYTQSVPDQAVTGQGVPRARTIYSTPDVQLLDEASFSAHLADLLAIRTTYGVANGTLHGRFETTAPSCFAFAVLLPSPNAGGRAAPHTEQGTTPPSVAKAPEQDEAVVASSASTRKLPAAERMKQQHEENQRLRRDLEQRIITVPYSGKPQPSGDAAIIVVANFSRETVRQVLNLHQDPILRRIRDKGEPVLLTTGSGNVKDSVASMSHGPTTVTLNLGPWRFAVVRIGKP
jgi:hypothetical protein